jgi:hypothetical protein
VSEVARCSRKTSPGSGRPACTPRPPGSAAPGLKDSIRLDSSAVATEQGARAGPRTRLRGFRSACSRLGRLNVWGVRGHGFSAAQLDRSATTLRACQPDPGWFLTSSPLLSRLRRSYGSGISELRGLRPPDRVRNSTLRVRGRWGERRFDSKNARGNHAGLGAHLRALVGEPSTPMSPSTCQARRAAPAVAVVLSLAHATPGRGGPRPPACVGLATSGAHRQPAQRTPPDAPSTTQRIGDEGHRNFERAHSAPCLSPCSDSPSPRVPILPAHGVASSVAFSLACAAPLPVGFCS